MSRKCPKRYHFFLNWLKANRSRFTFEPQVLRIQKRKISFSFRGITSALCFTLWITGSGGPYISVDAVRPDKKYAVRPGDELEGIIHFYGAEMSSKGGWITLREVPENRRIWKTKEELWTEICLESFLDWCRNKLSPDSRLVFYEGFSTYHTNVCTNEALAKDSMSDWEKLFVKEIGYDTATAEKLKAEARYFIVPLFKQSGETVLLNSKA